MRCSRALGLAVAAVAAATAAGCGLAGSTGPRAVVPTATGRREGAGVVVVCGDGLGGVVFSGGSSLFSRS